jgi:hypothetical protein
LIKPKDLVYPANIASQVLPGVRYVIVDGICYFKGGFEGGGRSTINAAEDILTAVAVQENIPINELRFVELSKLSCWYSSPEVLERRINMSV